MNPDDETRAEQDVKPVPPEGAGEETYARVE